MPMQRATFAAGCFWGVEQKFAQHFRSAGVQTAVGYTGGTLPKPTYERVCCGNTGHAEAVQLVYDDRVKYDDLVDFFYSIHNASLPRSKASQYRSAIFYDDEDQKAIAEAQTAAAQQRFPSAIATEITPSSEFWRAEEYHQKYYDKNGGSCH